MNGAFETTDPRRRRLISALLVIGIAILQLGSEYLSSHDAGRFLSKALTLALGLPPLTFGAFALFRWAAARRLGVLGPIFAGALGAGLFFAGLLWTIRAISGPSSVLQPHYGEWGRPDVLRIGFLLGLTNFGLWALAFIVPFAAEDARARRLEAEQLRAQTELAQLRSSLEPHFLLNTLNAIAGLVTEDPRKACVLLGAVGDLLRDSIAPEGEMQTLDQQIEWLRRYAQILEARHEGNLAFHWEVGGSTRSVLLPRLLLQPLVENAVKHGALMRKGGGEITVRTELAASNTLVCTIEDNGPGMTNGASRPGSFGLSSVRRRLALRYANAATLRLESTPGGTRSVVEVPLEHRGMR